ncbi:MAG: CAP domain-containing protein [Sporolactobacillus sp.]
MKQTRTIWLRLSVAFLGWLFLLSLPAMATHAPGRAEAHQAERQFTPVYLSEKQLAQQINRKRQREDKPPLVYDWDLFRLARLFAQQSANGEYSLPRSEKIDSLLKGLGRSSINSHYIVSHTSLAAALPETWWTSRDGVRLLRNTQATALGVGCAANGERRTWVVLYATLKESNH